VKKENMGGFEQEDMEEIPHWKSKTGSFLSFIKETVFIVIAAFLISLVIRFFVIEAFIIQQHSMDPTLFEGERVLVSKLVYRFSPVEYGDIIILKSPMRSADYVKRVIATEGETIEIKDGDLFIDGKQVDEPYVKSVDVSNYGPVKIPYDKVFVAGDNRPNSLDSRIFGPISEDDIIGKVFFIYWPMDKIGFVN